MAERKLPPASFVAELPDAEEPLAVEVEPLDERRFRAKLGERSIELEVVAVGPSSFSVALGDEMHEVAVTRRDRTIVASGPHGGLEVELIDRRRYRAGGAAGAAGGREVKAVMPGKVVTLLIKVGDTVEKDQALLVLEAMKMENEVRSPRAGVIKEIKVSPGQIVETGELMVTLE